MNAKYVFDRICELFTLYFKKTPAGTLISAGLFLISGAGLSLSGTIRFSKVFQDGSIISGEIGSGNTEWWMSIGCLFFGMVFLGFGLYFAYVMFNEQRRKIVVALEIRGLNATFDTSLAETIPFRVTGRRESLVIDIREQIYGTKNQQKDAISSVNLIPIHLRNYKNGKNRDDLSLYVGGLAPVPLLLLTGCLLSSESKMNFYDWDRKALKWTSPEVGTDLTSPLSIICDHVKDEVVLAFSVSYPINISELSSLFADVPIATLEIQNATPGMVISNASIEQLMQDFANMIVNLKAKGAKTVHLILAAPSVLSMRLGTMYSARNMPELIVYQYQQAQKENPYPWGIKMPNSESNQGELIFRT